MPLKQVIDEEAYMVRAREVFVRIGLLALMSAACFLIMRPFLPLVAWGIILAIAMYPAFRRLRAVVGGRDGLAAVLCTLGLLLIVILPCIALAGTLVDGVQLLAQGLQKQSLHIPPPPASVYSWPLIGPRVASAWELANRNVADALVKFAPQIQAHVPALISASAKLGGTILQFIIAILLSGFLLANTKGSSRLAHLIFARVFGDQGSEFEELTGATIRSVTNGILGVAVVQSFFASLGFLVVGLPGAGLWAVAFLISAVLQLGALVLVPAVLFVFATASTAHAVIFLIWCIVVGTMDNVLKPILLGRGSKVPMLVIFLGVLGGFMSMGIVGLFVGAIILSVAYKLVMAWLEGMEPTKQDRAESVAQSA